MVFLEECEARSWYCQKRSFFFFPSSLFSLSLSLSLWAVPPSPPPTLYYCLLLCHMPAGERKWKVSKQAPLQGELMADSKAGKFTSKEVLGRPDSVLAREDVCLKQNQRPQQKSSAKDRSWVLGPRWVVVSPYGLFSSCRVSSLETTLFSLFSWLLLIQSVLLQSQPTASKCFWKCFLGFGGSFWSRDGDWGWGGECRRLWGERCWTTSCNKSEESFESLRFLLVHGFQWTHVSFPLLFHSPFLILHCITLCPPVWYSAEEIKSHLWLMTAFHIQWLGCGVVVVCVFLIIPCNCLKKFPFWSSPKSASLFSLLNCGKMRRLLEHLLGK